MESLTKNKQSIETIEQMVNKAFGGLKIFKIDELQEGFFNVAYLIQLSDFSEVILKIAPTKNSVIMTHEKNIMYTEIETMRLIKDKTDVPIADVIFYDNSHTICESDYFFMTKISGKSLNSIFQEVDDQDKINISYKLGEYNAKINSITGESFGYYGQPEKQDKNWYKTFSSMIEDEINDAKALNIDIGVNPDTIIELLNQHKSIFEEVTIPKLVHWDLWNGNIFVENGIITGLIDFERCLWADELMEVGFRSHNSDENFLKGYGITALTNNQKLRVKWYDLYLFLICSLECDYRHYPDYGIYNWAKKNIIDIVNKQLL